MKTKPILALSLSALITYNVFQNRKNIRQKGALIIDHSRKLLDSQRQLQSQIKQFQKETLVTQQIVVDLMRQWRYVEQSLDTFLNNTED